MSESCSTLEETGNIYTILVGKPDGRRPLERHGCRWQDKIKLDLKVIGHEGDWGQDPVAGFCEQVE
jgi:hypothetical protein